MTGPGGRGRRLVIEADGGSRGNPGVAGYGALVRDVDGTLLAERAAPLGLASNNVAEYTGLIEGLRAVLDLGLAPGAQVAVRMDSKLVVEQMSGRWKIKHEDMRRLALQARDLARQITAAGGTVTYTWIPRAENLAADKLSNDGMDGVTVRRDHVAPVGETARQGVSEPDTLTLEFQDPDPDPDPVGQVSARPVATSPAGSATATNSSSAVPTADGPTFGEVKAHVSDVVFSTETD
ncbi:MAG TPA: reverse transcriptase-like protein, partial [Ornithinicoccus sp.]|nr:reverse transcriptase-like protein [Ornithinicoccus sp.]